MPWYRVAMKDAISCDNPRVGANNRRSVGIRMGQPDPGNAGSSTTESIGCVKQTRGTETSKYPAEEKTIVIS
jgi:hypothetical protein